MATPGQARLIVTFEDLPLQEAIRKLFGETGFVRSEALLISDRGREWILQKIIANLPHELVGAYRFEHILLSVNQYRKLNKAHLSKRLLILEHARKMQKAECFYRGKLATECSNEVDLDRVKPGKRGGEYAIENTVLSCSHHNRSRGSRQVDAFWNQ
jgi:hypothetical protein